MHRRFCLSLDYNDLYTAVEEINKRYAFEDKQKLPLSEKVLLFRMGSELYNTANLYVSGFMDFLYVKAMGRIGRMDDPTGSLFLDLKFHGDSETVQLQSRDVSTRGIYMFSVSMSNSDETLTKAVEASHETVDKYNMFNSTLMRIPKPKIVGDVVFSQQYSSDKQSTDNIARAAELARKRGLDGVNVPIDAIPDLERRVGSDFLYVGFGLNGHSQDFISSLNGNTMIVLDKAHSKLTNKEYKSV